LERRRIHPSADVRQVAARRVTTRTAARALEVFGAADRIAGQDVLDLERSAQCVVNLLVQRVRKVLDL
jgi:hypothetical protein